MFYSFHLDTIIIRWLKPMITCLNDGVVLIPIEVFSCNWFDMKASCVSNRRSPRGKIWTKGKARLMHRIQMSAQNCQLIHDTSIWSLDENKTLNSYSYSLRHHHCLEKTCLSKTKMIPTCHLNNRCLFFASLVKQKLKLLELSLLP